MNLTRLCQRSAGAKTVGMTILFGVLLGLTFDSSNVFAGGGPNVSGAKLYIQQNNIPQAFEALYREINEVDANNEDAWYLLGYLYARQKKYDKMMEAFDKAVELKPKFKEKGIKIGKDSGTQFHSEFGVDLILQVVWGNVFNTGVKHFNDGINAADDSSRAKGFDLAIESFRTAAMVQPDSTLSYRNWAAALLNAGRPEESVEPLKKALEANPKDSDVRLMLAQVYINAGNDSLALPVLQQLWADDVRTEEVAENLSRTYMRIGQIDSAKSVYKEAIAMNPDNFDFRYNFGTILLDAKDYDNAIEQLTKAYEMDSESADVNYNLGAAYLNRGVETREALPEDSEDQSYLKDFERAFPYLEKSIAMNPDEEVIWMTLGRIAGQLNKMSLAGYAFSKGEPLKSAVDGAVRVGMQGDALKTILGDPDQVRPVESEQFAAVEEWIYKERSTTPGKVVIGKQMNVYVDNGRVDAIMIME